MGAMNFLVGQVDQAVQVTLVAPAQHRIKEHGAQCRRQGQGHVRRDAVPFPTFQNLDDRQVGFRDGFKQPGFLQKFFVLGMAHIGQVRVENDGQITLHGSAGVA